MVNRDLLVAAVGRASCVVEVLLLDVDHSSAHVKVVWLVRHAQILILDLSDRPSFGHVSSSTSSTHCTTTNTGVGERLELSMSSIIVVPSSQQVRLSDVGVDQHSRARKHAERSTTKVTDLDTFECNDWLLIDTSVVGESLGILTPQSESDTLVALIDESQFTLLNRSLRSLADNLAELAVAVQDTDDIASLVGFDTLELVDAYKLVLDFGNVGSIGAFFDLGRVFEGDFIFVLKVAELLFGDVDFGFRDEIDVVLFEERVEAIDGVIEASSLDLATVVEQIDGEELAFTSLVRPVTDV